MVLNIISTASMIGVGRVYQDLMIDNEKLVARLICLMMDAIGVDHKEAKDYLRKSKINFKIVIIMILLQCSYDKAKENVLQAGVFVQKALMKGEKR
ncbi:N-acetylmuramic acid 6-phosphate etherase [Virgibacillus chiguensis]|uniref:N-acetylmuramic acid 6-phosphate etherase n=1 Tax=Virgibacillus chiguensis TaxID=411959 RepID=A0A1M5M2A5_9BACI|nr:N-acetylmuramic acid 6-phosphate etherase [Virgibacillus chiguensis]